MEKKIEEKIDLYCGIYQQAYEKAAKVNPDSARHMASEIFEQVARDLRSELISQLRKEENNEEGGNNGQKVKEKDNDIPATKKQRQALHKFGIEHIPEDLTKKEASEILNKLIGLSKEGNREAINEIVKDLNADNDWV